MSAEKLEIHAAAAEKDLSVPAVDVPVDAGAHPLRDYGLFARSAAEAAGTFLLIFGGIGAALFSGQGGIPVPLAFGLAVTGAIIAFGYISGAHYNPAVTLGTALAGRTPWVSVLPYVLAQFVGGTAAIAVLWAVISGHPQIESTQQFFTTAANGFGEETQTKFPLSSVFLAEVIGTAVFVAVILGSTARRANKALAPFAIGLTLVVLATVLGPLSNGSLNPVRSTVVAFFADAWVAEKLWVFWVAPLLGGAIAGLLYRSIDAFHEPVRVTESAVVLPAAGTVTAPAAGSVAATDAVADPDAGAVEDEDRAAPLDPTRAADAKPAEGARDFFERGPESR